MIVYRYEDAEGFGPYTAIWIDEGLRDMYNLHNDSSDYARSRWPTIVAPEDYRRPRCALISLEAVNNWFDDYHSALRDAGFSLVSYVVNHVMPKPDEVGQVVFDLDRAKRVESSHLL